MKGHDIVAEGMVQAVHDLSINPVTRELWIHSVPTNADSSYEGVEVGVEHLMVAQVTKNLSILRKLSSTLPVVIHLQTVGGFYEQGMAIYNAIRFMPFHVTMLVYTYARSMSSIILQAADRRVMMPDSYFMMHWGSMEISGDLRSVLSNMDFVRTQNDRMIDIYVAAARNGKRFDKKSEPYIRCAIERAMELKGDFFLQPDDAIEWGFADEVFDGDWEGLK